MRLSLERPSRIGPFRLPAGKSRKSRSNLSKIAIVTPWYGEDAKGGAEQQAYQLAGRLAKLGHHVDVLTTCNRGFLTDWSVDHFRPGVYHDAGVRVHRFAVDARDIAAFDQANGRMLATAHPTLRAGISPVADADADIFFRENINSSSLVRYIERETHDYDAFVFLPYLYGVIVHGIAACDPARAFLVPCLHDEVYAYLPQVADMVQRVGGLLFLSEGERDLAIRLYGPGISKKAVVTGAGIELFELALPATLVELPRNLGETPFVLCLGRRDPTKNTDLLVAAYHDYRLARPEGRLQLVLAGPGNGSYDDAAAGVHDLGLVEEELKASLLRSCLSLFQPSQNESFSRVMMEAWTAGRPVAAHSACSATAQAVRAAKGGFLAGSKAEWERLFDRLENAQPSALAAMGRSGKDHVENNLAWDTVIARYSAALTPPRARIAPKERRSLRPIHQILPTLDLGDAISNQALAIRAYLREQGHESEIIVRYVHEQLAGDVRIYPSYDVEPQAALIYHHSIGSEVTDFATSHGGPKCLIYHNITPHHFFAGYDDAMMNRLSQGREQLADITRTFDFAFGDSTYNCDELRDMGIESPGVLPIVVDPSRWQVRPDRAIRERLTDGRNNILFVGRIAPNKSQHDLVRAFADYRTMDESARLILAGKFDPNSRYVRELQGLIEDLGLGDSVEFTGHLTESELMAYYMSAKLLWSMSEHEGFCVPLVEAMWFDVPVLAFRSSAVPETLGSAGIMFTSKDDLLNVAALARVMVSDEDLREQVLASQRVRRSSFTHAGTEAAMAEIVRRLGRGALATA